MRNTIYLMLFLVVISACGNESNKSEITVCECYEMSHSGEEIKLDNQGNAYYSNEQAIQNFRNKANDAFEVEDTGFVAALDKLNSIEKKWWDLCKEKMGPNKISEQIRVREELAKCK